MQTLVRLFGTPIRKGVQWYLRKPREFNYGTIKLIVAPGVFHPGFFFSTRYVLEFLSNESLAGQRFLEVGCGSGVISILAAQKGAEVTAIDINRKAVTNTIENAARNSVKVQVITSDLFGNVLPIRFDLPCTKANTPAGTLLFSIARKMAIPTISQVEGCAG